MFRDGAGRSDDSEDDDDDDDVDEWTRTTTRSVAAAVIDVWRAALEDIRGRLAALDDARGGSAEEADAGRGCGQRLQAWQHMSFNEFKRLDTDSSGRSSTSMSSSGVVAQHGLQATAGGGATLGRKCTEAELQAAHSRKNAWLVGLNMRSKGFLVLRDRASSELLLSCFAPPGWELSKNTSSRLFTILATRSVVAALNEDKSPNNSIQDSNKRKMEENLNASGYSL